MDFTPLNLVASNNDHSFVTALFEAAAYPGARDMNDYAQGDEALKNTGPKKHFFGFSVKHPN